jgi:hypothetical protein
VLEGERRLNGAWDCGSYSTSFQVGGTRPRGDEHLLFTRSKGWARQYITRSIASASTPAGQNANEATAQ